MIRAQFHRAALAENIAQQFGWLPFLVVSVTLLCLASFCA